MSILTRETRSNGLDKIVPNSWVADKKSPPMCSVKISINNKNKHEPYYSPRVAIYTSRRDFFKYKDKIKYSTVVKEEGCFRVERCVTENYVTSCDMCFRYIIIFIDMHDMYACVKSSRSTMSCRSYGGSVYKSRTVS